MTALPINIDELLTGQIVEWERLEFKKGWNPEEIIHTVCAFANDINNWGGGYLIIGIEEDKGQPIFPPIGIPPYKTDEIQKELVNLSYRIRPNYHPVVAPIIFQEKMILLIWCPGGQTRPYQAPATLGKGSFYLYFIRRNSTTVKAQTKDIHQLHELANQVPFDDRIYHQSDLQDLQFGIIKDFLRDVKSDLISEVDKIPFEQLCRQMQIIQGPKEYLKPLNIGLLMFNSNPEQFFPYARIEIVDFHDETGDSFSEKIFKGPIHIQLKEALRYLQSMFIKEEIRKREDCAEADRFYNYPFVALEEALANAVYHKDYAQREPIEISIKPDQIKILSFPGPLPPLKIEDLNKGSARVRTYRNRRIGDFLKELHLTEGRCTGVPKIHKAMKDNGSPPAIFETDEEGLYFLTILPIHPEATRKATAPNQNRSMEEQTHRYTGVFEAETHRYTGVFPIETLSKELQMLINNFNKRSSKKELCLVIQKLCAWQPLTAQQLMDLLKRRDKKHFVRSHLTPMIKEGTLKYLFPEDQDSPNQAYTRENEDNG
ncbi:MAG: RNA-binding domain-containing protein [Candidatus Rhabdochlamydia sp.]